MAGGTETPTNNESSDSESGLSTYERIKIYLSTTHRAMTQDDINSGYDRISARLDATRQELAAHKSSVNSEIRQIKDSISKLSNGGPRPRDRDSYASAVLAAPSSHSSPRANDLLSQETRIYWQFRKCAKMHPVHGETEAELWLGLQDFLRSKLRIPSTEVLQSDIVSVRKMRMGRGRGRQPVGEVVVVFVDVDTRDRVCSYARNLAQYVDSSNNPTAGVRMYIPAHLGGVQKTLMQ